MSTFREITRSDVASWAESLNIDPLLVDSLYSIFKGARWEVGAAKAYLVRMLQETNGFTWFRERNPAVSGYNTGRGFIQLTHEDMYKGLQQYLDKTCGPGKYDVLSPNGMETVATDPFLRAESAKYFAQQKNLYKIATLTEMVVCVNGGVNGLEDTIKLALRLEVGNEAVFLQKELAAFTKRMEQHPPILQPGVKDFIVGGVMFDCGVASVQQKLADLGFLDAGAAAVDGRYGNKTMNAVKNFQKENGLAVDGKVGPKTLSKLNEVHRSATHPSSDAQSETKDQREETAKDQAGKANDRPAPGLMNDGVPSTVPPPKPVNYTIQPGDTLTGISKATGVSVQSILELNPSIKDPNKIKAFANIKLPEGVTPPQRRSLPKPTPFSAPVKVKPNDTLSSLAQKHGCTVDQLISQNQHLQSNPNNLQVGQELNIPVPNLSMGCNSAVSGGIPELPDAAFGRSTSPS